MSQIPASDIFEHFLPGPNMGAEDEADTAKSKEIEEEYKVLTDWMKDTLGDKVEKVTVRRCTLHAAAPPQVPDLAWFQHLWWFQHLKLK